MLSIELGHFALVLAFALAVVQVCVSIYAWQRPNQGGYNFVQQASGLQFLLVLLSFAALTTAFVTSDFSLKLAYEHSHSLQPTLYKFTSVWGQSRRINAPLGFDLNPVWRSRGDRRGEPA